MRILVAAIPAYGHLFPVLPLAAACAAAGHQVTVATGAPFLGRLPWPTVPGIAAGVELDAVVQETQRRHPDRHGPDLAVAMFADTTAELVSGALDEVFARSRPDLVIFEAMNVGAAVAADRHDIPAVGFAIGLAPFVVDLIHTAVRDFQGHFWIDRGRPVPTGTGLLGAALIDPSPPSLAVTDGPASAVPRWPIRSVAYTDGSSRIPDWLVDNRSRPVIYLTLGTVSFGAVEVIRRAIDQIEPLPVDLLVAVGPEGDPAALGAVGARVHVERFVPQAQVLERIEVIVHHGGTGTVLGAAAAGVPQLILPQGADQFLNADLVTRAGIGRALRADEQLGGAITDAVRVLLDAGPPRQRAAQLRAEIAGMPAPEAIVSQLEKLVAGG
ncbi:MAG TPA: glycosyltransferase [Nakamurella multipartita]|nr:glycosyltransferase [Nakamurella multipartita]